MGRFAYCRNTGPDNGFTLLELLVVLSILGLMSMIVLVSLPGSRERLELKSAGRDVMLQMVESRTRAIRSRGDARFFLDIARKEYWTDEPETSRILPRDIELEIYTARAEQRDNNLAAIVFFPDGSSTGGYVRLSRGKDSYRIAVNWLTGKIVMDHEKAQD